MLFGRLSGPKLASAASHAPEEFACFLLGLLEYLSLRAGKIFTRAVDVKVQHRHCGLVRRAFALCADVGGMFQGSRNFGRVGRGENTRLKIKGVAILGYGAGPIVLRAGPAGRAGTGCSWVIGRFAGHRFKLS